MSILEIITFLIPLTSTISLAKHIHYGTISQICLVHSSITMQRDMHLIEIVDASLYMTTENASDYKTLLVHNHIKVAFKLLFIS